MGEVTRIEWCAHTFNAWRGCTKVSEGCKFCYADKMSGRNPGTLGIWGPKGTRVIAAESFWKQPLKWNREAEVAGERRRVFCASLADVFEGYETMPIDAWEPVAAARRRLLGLIQNTPNLDWLLLTKRPENIMPLLRSIPLAESNPGGPSLADCMPFANVWIGVSVEDQATADERIPHLLKVPAVVRFLSCEPLLSDVDLSMALEPFHTYAPDMSRNPAPIQWVICGGESGPHARPMHPEWARSLRDQCASAGVPFLFKQFGEYTPVRPDHGSGWRLIDRSGKTVDITGEGTEYVYNVGKKEAGRLLDGVLHDGYPVVNGLEAS